MNPYASRSDGWARIGQRASRRKQILVLLARRRGMWGSVMCGGLHSESTRAATAVSIARAPWYGTDIWRTRLGSQQPTDASWVTGVISQLGVRIASRSRRSYGA